MKGLAIAEREIEATVKEKSIGFVIMFEVLIVASTSLLGIGYALMTDPYSFTEMQKMSSLVKVGVVSENAEVYGSFMEKHSMQWVKIGDEQAAIRLLEGGQLDAVVSGNLVLGESPDIVKIILPENSPRKEFTKIGIKGVLLDMEEKLRKERMARIGTKLSFVTTLPISRGSQESAKQNAEVYYLFTIPLLMVLPAFVGGSLIIDSIIQEIEKKTIINLKTAPLKSRTIVIWKIAGVFIITFLQIAIWPLIIMANGLEIANLGILIAAASGYAFIFISLSAALSLLLKSNKNAQFSYLIITSLIIGILSPAISYNTPLRGFSPTYLFAALGAGQNYMNFSFELMTIAALAVIAFASAVYFSREIEKIII